MQTTQSKNAEAKGAARPRGRPQQRSDADTGQVILAAASRAFLDFGFDVSMDAIAREAGVSKKTIYRLFANKVDLLRAIITTRREGFLLAIGTEAVRKLPLAEALHRVLDDFAQLVLKPDAVALNRLSTAESVRWPEIAAAFYDEGPARSVEVLAGWLRQQCDDGRLRLADPGLAASMLLGMVVSEPLRAATLGARPLPSRDEIEQRVSLAVDIFIRGCAAAEHRD